MVLALIAGPLIGLSVAILSLPVFAILDGSAGFCLTEGWEDCASGAIWSLLLFGPLFLIIGLFFGSPAIFIWLGKRDISDKP